MRPLVKRVADAIVYCAAGLRTALPALLGLCLLPVAILLSLTVVVLPWLPQLVRPMRALANAERRRAGRLLGREIPEPYPRLRGGAVEQALALLRSPTTWRDAVWMCLHGITGLFAGVLVITLVPSILFTLSMPLWWWAAPPGSQSAFVPLHTWGQALTLPFLQAGVNLTALLLLVPRFPYWQARLADALLRPTRRVSLSERVERLTETRAGALEAHGAELRRIERDLHDGTQAQLVAAALRLGLADRRFDADPEASRELFLEAREGIEDALTQLRGVIRGIYPPILSDRGLGGAVRALAAAQPIPVALDLPADRMRAPAAVEAAAYFVVAEALTNVAKHSGASRAEVSVRREGDRLVVAVRDDGRGGADPARGTGLAGIRRRVAAMDGTTGVDSPAGRGTTLRVELPCGS
ncbi:sensor histidine kinase [Spirillospora sp. NPDC127200]